MLARSTHGQSYLPKGSSSSLLLFAAGRPGHSKKEVSLLASIAYREFLTLLDDAAELEDAHRELRTGQPGRQWRLGSLNRAAVVMCLSAWEAYIEEIVKESIDLIRPAAPHQTLWQSLNADARAQVGRFNNPNVENVRRLIADTLGLQDVSANWAWQNTTARQARDRLAEAIAIRHQVAHGVNPRPTVHNNYASRLPGFFRRLGLSTDREIRSYLVNTLHVPNPWPE